MRYLLPIILLVISVSCSSSKKTAEKMQDTLETSIKFKVLAQSSLHGNGREGIKKGHYIFKEEKSWKKFFSQIGTLRNDINHTTFNELPEMDFEKEMIIAVVAPVVGSGGVKIEVEKVIETKGNLKVFYNMVAKPGFATMVMNQPYVIIKLPKIDKPIEWIGKL